jgi:putative nucleotidyltransferase with HDIG domain
MQGFVRPDMDTIEKMVQSVKDLPTGPRILPKLFALLENEYASTEEVGDMIAFEPALTVRLLKFCNSAYFGGSEPVNNVPEAIGRVGFRALRPLMTAVCGSTAFVLPAACGLNADQLWKHSLLTAFGSKFLAESVSENSDTLFTCGLLHDIGRIVLARSKGAKYGDLLARANAEKAQASGWETSNFGFNHAEVGDYLLRTWHFPDLITDAVRFHHFPQEANSPKAAACVYLGNVLAHTLDNSLSVEDLPNGELDLSLKLLGITHKMMDDYAEKIQENMNYVSALL